MIERDDRDFSGAADSVPAADISMLTEIELAEELRVDPTTLRLWHRNRTGPPRIKLSPRAARYRRTDVVRWLAECEARGGVDG